MDFLMLLPHGVRIVIEVDGKHHYASPEGLADPALYARTVAADRELQLAGHHVFRFGAVELCGDVGERVVKRFFDDLFKSFEVNA
jgi:very-short-patch-repair endonuclease